MRSINEMQQGVDELQRQNQSGLYKQGTTAKVGQMTAAKYQLEGELTSIVKQSSSTKDVYYKFTLKLFDVQEGTIEWQDEKEIRKTSKTLTGASPCNAEPPCTRPWPWSPPRALAWGSSASAQNRAPKIAVTDLAYAQRVSEYFVAGTYQRSSQMSAQGSHSGGHSHGMYGGRGRIGQPVGAGL